MQNAEILSWLGKAVLLRTAPVDVIKLALLTLSIGARDVRVLCDTLSGGNGTLLKPKMKL